MTFLFRITIAQRNSHSPKYFFAVDLTKPVASQIPRFAVFAMKKKAEAEKKTITPGIYRFLSTDALFLLTRCRVLMGSFLLQEIRTGQRFTKDSLTRWIQLMSI